MRPEPTLETARLILRPYAVSDIPDLLPLIGTREVAATTLRIPHPYTEVDAKEFIAAVQPGDEVRRAVILRSSNRLIGGIGLRVNEPHSNAELGYWLGVPYWGQGYATEAAREMLRYGFQQLGLHRIFASHFEGNTASGRILQKLGMRHEGCQRQHIRKWNRFLDLELYGLLRDEWHRE
jgi:[ribosomal protein S5]-alanine N-acetyltransferase